MRIKKTAVFLSTFLIVSSVLAEDLESILEDVPQAKNTVKIKKFNKVGFVDTIKKWIARPTPEQNVFLRLVESEDWAGATLQYPISFEGTALQRSANGKALFGLLQFKAGLPVTGLETLFSVVKPSEIDNELQTQWVKIAGPSQSAWDIVRVTWSPQWEKIFGPQIGFRVTSNTGLPATVSALEKLSESAPEESSEKAQIDWQLVLKYGIEDQTEKAAKALVRLKQSPAVNTDINLIQLTAARLLYQKAYFQAAIKNYEKIPKSSDYWLEAQEEIAWSYIRKGEPQNALAITQSLINPGLSQLVGAEAFLVRSLSQLKVCDYSGVMDSLKIFSKLFKQRTLKLNEIVANGSNSDIVNVFEKMKIKKQNISDLGPLALTLPRSITQDKSLFEMVQKQKNLEAESKIAEALYARSLSQTGLQSFFEQQKKTTLERAQRAKSDAFSRVKELAKNEVDEIQKVLQKLHIVEAEVIQQTSVAGKLAKLVNTPTSEQKGSTGAKTAEVLRFPAENEMWFDEISNYKVDIRKACQLTR